MLRIVLEAASAFESMMFAVLIILCILYPSSGLLFPTSSLSSRINPHKACLNRTPATSSKRMQVNDFQFLMSYLQKVDPDQARAEFFFFFFAGSGALGIGAAQIPRLLKENKALVSRSQSSITEGGADFDVSRLAMIGFPEPLKSKDLEKIIKNAKNVEEVLKLGPKKSYMAQLGYVEFEGFEKSLPNCNPLALYAVWEAMSQGSGTLCSPQQYTEKLEKWRSNGYLDSFKGEFLVAQLKKSLAISTFGFLILLVIDLIVESGMNAWM